MTTQVEPTRSRNQHIFNLTVALETALLECDELGLDAEKVEFDGRFRPRIFVANNGKTRELLREGKAYVYGMEAQHGTRLHLVQMQLNNCKIIWKTDSLTH